MATVPDEQAESTDVFKPSSPKQVATTSLGMLREVTEDLRRRASGGCPSAASPRTIPRSASGLPFRTRTARRSDPAERPRPGYPSRPALRATRSRRSDRCGTTVARPFREKARSRCSPDLRRLLASIPGRVEQRHVSMPHRPLTRPFQTASRAVPSALINPIPVMATRRRLIAASAAESAAPSSRRPRTDAGRKLLPKSIWRIVLRGARRFSRMPVPVTCRQIAILLRIAPAGVVEEQIEPVLVEQVEGVRAPHHPDLGEPHGGRHAVHARRSRTARTDTC